MDPHTELGMVERAQRQPHALALGDALHIVHRDRELGGVLRREQCNRIVRTERRIE